MKTLANRVKGGQCQSWNKVEGIQIPWLCFKRKGLNLGRKQTIFFLREFSHRQGFPVLQPVPGPFTSISCTLAKLLNLLFYENEGEIASTCLSNLQ